MNHKAVYRTAPPRCWRFEPRSNSHWQIVEISNRLPNLSAKQSELTVRTKNVREEKTYQLSKKLYFAKTCPIIAQKVPQKVSKTIR